MLEIFTNHRGLAVNLCCNKSKKIFDFTGFWSFKTNVLTVNHAKL